MMTLPSGQHILIPLLFILTLVYQYHAWQTEHCQLVTLVPDPTPTYCARSRMSLWNGMSLWVGCFHCGIYIYVCVNVTFNLCSVGSRIQNKLSR